MVISLHPHHHHVVDVTPEQELESCSGGHCAITGKSSSHENKFRIAGHDDKQSLNGDAFRVFILDGDVLIVQNEIKTRFVKSESNAGLVYICVEDSSPP